MNEAVLAVAALGAFVAFCLVLWVVLCAAFWPRVLVRFNAPRRGDMPWWSWPVFILMCVGFGVYVYAGTKSLFFWLPKSWGSRDEDGEWMTAASQIASILATYGALALPVFLFSVADKSVRLARLDALATFVKRLPPPDRRAAGGVEEVDHR